MTKPDQPTPGWIVREGRNLLGATDMVRIALLSLMLGGIFLVFHFFGVTDIGYDVNRITRSVFEWLYDRWRSDLRDTWFAHSHLVPLVSLWLVWRDRRTLAALPKRANLFGLAVIVASLLLHWAGAKSEQTRLSIVSLIGLSWGIPLFLCGWPVARRLLFPCGFLVFSLPLNFFDAATYPLRLFAAGVTTTLLSGLGIDVTRVGSAVVDTATGFTMELADSRSGIFAFTAIAAFALVCAHLAAIRMRWKAALVAAALPLLVFSNIVRGLVVMLAVAAYGSGAGRVMYDYASGPVTVVLSFGVLAWVAMRLHRRAAIGTTASPQPPAAPPPDVPSGRPLTPWLAALAVLAVASWWIPRNLDVNYIDTAGVALDMPADLPSWSGGSVLFCHNPADGSNFADPALKPGDPCPNCGQPLYQMSAIEKQLLPTDTILRKTRYEDRTGRKVFFTIVLSGQKRSSIHRPEVCLVGQNNEIDRSFIHTVDLGAGKTLKVKILEMLHRVQKPDGTTAVWTTYYAYWFAGKDRETPHHLQRMLWMASDRLFRNQSYRWAYISVSGLRAPGGTAYLSEIDQFLRDAYPHLHNSD